MASKLRVEWWRLRDTEDGNTSNAFAIPGVAPVTKTVSGTALTGAGRVTVPANVAGYTRFHARLMSDVECIVSVAPAGDAGTTYDASATEETGIWVPANTPVFIPVTPGQLLSAATGLAFA